MSTVISASTTLNTAFNVLPDTSGVLALATGATPTTAVTIDASQNVGIGTSSPTTYGGFTTLEVGSTSGNAGLFSAKHANGNALMFNSSGVATFGSTAAYATTFISYSVERMRIDSSGNVGIGTTTPAVQLQQYLPSGTTYRQITNGTVNITEYASTAVAACSYGTTSSHPLLFTTANTERMRIDSSGNVGIGTSTLNQPLMVKTDTDFVVGIGKGSSGAGARIGAYNLAVNAYKDFIVDGATIQFAISGTEKARIDTSGNLLVGQTSADGQLAVTGTGTTAIFAKSSSASNSTYATIMRNSASTNIFYVRSDGFINTGLAALSPYNNSITGRSMMVDNTGGLGYLASVRAAKTNIASLTDISWVYNLNPVEFNYRKKDEENKFTDEFESEKHYGLIAEEVETVNQELCFYDNDGTLRGVSYDKLTSVLIKAIQEQQALIQAQAADIAALKAKVGL